MTPAFKKKIYKKDWKHKLKALNYFVTSIKFKRLSFNIFLP